MAWEQLQKDIAGLSSFSKQNTVENAGHMIQDDNPRVVIDAIEEMISKINQAKKK